MKIIGSDFRLLGGFFAIIFLIAIIGIFGILEIQFLNRAVIELGEIYLPMQAATLGMKIDNSQYAMSIRNFVFWKNTRYLEAASSTADLKIIETTLLDFKKNLDQYAKFIRTQEQRDWLVKIKDYHNQLNILGDKIIKLAGNLDKAQDPKIIQNSINRTMIEFENSLFKIDDFLSDVVQKDNLRQINEQLKKTNMAKNRSVLMLGISLIMALIIGLLTAFSVFNNLKNERNRREHLVKRMIKLEEQERGDLSMEVHDQMGQDLSGLKIFLGVIDMKIQEEPVLAGRNFIQKELEESKKILTGLMQRMHNISELLRPSALDDVGLVDTVNGLLMQQKQVTGINYIFKNDNFRLNPKGEFSLALYRVIQEGLTNIARHSKAKNVEIDLESRDNICYLTIKDDGAGFDYSKFLKDRHKSSKLGLMGLEERIELLGGRMNIVAIPGKGTKISVELPISKV